MSAATPSAPSCHSLLLLGRQGRVVFKWVIRIYEVSFECISVVCYNDVYSSFLTCITVKKIHVHTYIHTYTYIHPSIQTYVHAYIRTYMHAYIHAHACNIDVERAPYPPLRCTATPKLATTAVKAASV